MSRRFWFTFTKPARPTILSMGCGVTAYDLADARKLLQEQVFSNYGAELIDEVIEDIDISTLDDKHVRPNMGNPVVRGVWFPHV